MKEYPTILVIIPTPLAPKMLSYIINNNSIVDFMGYHCLIVGVQLIGTTLRVPDTIELTLQPLTPILEVPNATG